MNYLRFLWDHPDDPYGNVQHIIENGLTTDDVIATVSNPLSHGTSRSSNIPCLWGYTPDGTYIIVIYEQIDEVSIRVVTAYQVPEPA
jgi:hypothetical protein